MERYDVLIIGVGRAGLTAGLYCGRARLKTLIVEKGVPGGELVNTARIEDYPGFEAISGPELAERLERQARKFGVEIAMDEVVEVASAGTPFGPSPSSRSGLWLTRRSRCTGTRSWRRSRARTTWRRSS
jgi:thioredoxin reductase (NADPH)